MTLRRMGHRGHGTCEAELHDLELTTQCHYSRQRKGFRAI